MVIEIKITAETPAELAAWLAQLNGQALAIVPAPPAEVINQKQESLIRGQEANGFPNHWKETVYALIKRKVPFTTRDISQTDRDYVRRSKLAKRLGSLEEIKLDGIEYGLHTQKTNKQYTFTPYWYENGARIYAANVPDKPNILPAARQFRRASKTDTLSNYINNG